ncbi:sialate O-acetylesterase [Flavobacterium sp. ST-75]|uniref:Sialate O-acetylesterase n=1 Tax=Flavobacterium rhizophilum TaxID=3163296 RepID=A0ABW8YHR7_9FLAO
MKKALLLFFTLILSITAKAQIKLPEIVSNGMVLQREEPINIWGWATPNEKVTVRFNNKKYKTITTKNGVWKVILSPIKAGGPYSMEIEGSNKIILNDILVGDVWLCSGQSNMVHQMRLHNVLYADEIANASYDGIRQFFVPNTVNLSGPQTKLPESSWKKAINPDINEFSAVAYFFAKELYQKYKVPIGIINSSWGGTPIEAWVSEKGFKEFPNVLETINRNKDTLYINSQNTLPQTETPLPKDKGLEEKWFDTVYKPKGWRNIAIPGYWEDQGIKGLDGTVWYRREIDIPEAMTKKKAMVFLGRIVDADVLYINGKRIGNTTYMYPQRRYSVANDVLKPGKNLFVVQVTNNFGKGGFVPDKPYYIVAGKDTIDLTGYWQYKVGRVNMPFNKNYNKIALHYQPTALYNAMISPLINYNIKGFVWYQGESNTGNASEYSKLQAALIDDWRNKWNKQLPFLYVQLPGFMDYNYLPSESQWALFREEQAKSLSIPKTAMAVAIDLGEWNDIHPDRKKEVGERLALAAEKTAYNEPIISSGPSYKSSEIKGNKIIVSFNNTGNGLSTTDGEAPSEFAIAGADKNFVWAKTKIEGNTVILWNESIEKPLYIRYAWADNPVNPNLINKENLPAVPFRTDE